MAYQTITYEVADSICTITLNRPDQLNALNADDVRRADRCVR